MREKYQDFSRVMSGNRKGLFWSLFAVLILLASWYIYLVNTTALNGVRWSSNSTKVSELQGTVSELESSYLSLKRTITLSLAYDEGFEDARAVTFVSAKTLGAVTYNNDL